MKIQVITLFPDLIAAFLETSLIGKARSNGAISTSVIPLRDFADPPHYHVDDAPYGGGAGMVMKPEPVAKAIEHAKASDPSALTVLLSPRGEVFNQQTAVALAKASGLIFICPRYEGIDERVVELLVDKELSIGDYVLMGGDVAAMVVIEASARLIPGVVGNEESVASESFSVQDDGSVLLEAPQYTRPPEFRGRHVPEVLLSGDHQRVNEYRHSEALKATATRRPDLLKR